MLDNRFGTPIEPGNFTRSKLGDQRLLHFAAAPNQKGPILIGSSL